MTSWIALVAIAAVAAVAAQAAETAPRATAKEKTSAGDLIIEPINHSAIRFEFAGKQYYVDPSGTADWPAMPKADAIFITHEHYDHLDAKTISTIRKDGTVIVASTPAAKAAGFGQVITPGETQQVLGITVEGVPAYNITADRLKYHPKDRQDVGFILTFGGKRVYIAGDTEGTPEMRAPKNIDIAFIPINLPYTMPPREAAEAVSRLQTQSALSLPPGQVRPERDEEALGRYARDRSPRPPASMTSRITPGAEMTRPTRRTHAPAAAPWYQRARRWGQTNLTELDPQRIDLAWWQRYWRKTKVQGVIVNAGGIVAYYPSRFEHHYRAQHLGNRDLFGEIVAAARKQKLAILARMDSNRADEPFYHAHPDWFAVDAAGKPHRAGDRYLACINGPYYREYLPQILKEIIERYHPDGFTDNSWTGAGRRTICHCDACRSSFRAFTQDNCRTPRQARLERPRLPPAGSAGATPAAPSCGT